MLRVKNLKAFMIGVMLRHNDKEEVKKADADCIINDLSGLVKILRGL